MLLAVAVMTLSSQSLLTDNANYKKVKDLKRLQVQAYENADYPEVIRLSNEIDRYTALLNKEIEVQLAAYRARSSLTMLNDRLAQASRWNAKKISRLSWPRGRPSTISPTKNSTPRKIT